MDWEELRAAQEQEQREARLRLSHQVNYDPEESARIFGLAAKTGLPQEVVAGDVDGLDEAVRSNSFDYEKYTDKVNGSPIFNKFAEESPYNFAVLDRDREGMSQVERSVRDVGLGYMQGRATTQLADLRSADIAQGGATPEQKARMDDLRKLLEGGDFGAEGHVMKLLVGTARQAPIQAKLLYESADEMMLGGMMGATAGGLMGGGATAPIGGVGAIPGVLAGWTAGIGAGAYSGRTMAAFELERGLAFDQYMEQGFDRKDALMFANAVGSVNAVLESFGAGALVKRVPGFRKIMKDRVGDAVADIFAKPTMKHAIARAGIQYGEGVVTEVITEVMQDTTIMMAEEHMKTTARNVSGDTRPSMAMGEIPLFEQWKATAIHTLYGTLLIGSAGPIMNYKADAKRAKDSMARQESWSRLKEGVDNSTTKEEARSIWDEFISRLSKDGPVKEVRYTREAWKEYWQSEKIDPDQAAADLGIDLETINVLDDDIVIPFGTFLDKIVPSEHFTGLQKDLRVGNEMTMRESQQWFHDQDEIIKAVRLEVDKVGDHSVLRDMEHDVTGMLMSGGRFTKEAAGPQAEMFVTQIYNLAMQEGKDPKKLLADKLDSIRRQVPESLSGGDFELGVDELLNSIREGHYPKQREIYGNNLIDMMRGAGGIQDDGGEMSNRDLGKLYPGMISKAGKTVDGMAELAFEAGFIKEYDSNMFLEALDQQLSGNEVYSAQHAPDVALEELLARMEQAAQFFEEESIDITNMSNAEVRRAMDGIQTLNQSTSQTLTEWTELLIELTASGVQGQGNGAPLSTVVSEARNIMEEAKLKLDKVNDAFVLSDDEVFNDPKSAESMAVAEASTEYEAAKKTYDQVVKDNPEDTRDSKTSADNVDTMLTKAERTRPRVSGKQDFKDVELTDRVTEDGKGKDVTYKAQDRYNNAVKSRNILKQLAKCVNG